MRRVTIRDIAKRLGLSPATISTALTGRRNGVFVGEDTRDLVVRTAAEMGYRRRWLRDQPPQLERIGLFCPMHSLFYNTVMELCQLFSRQGFRVIVHVSKEGPEACDLAKQLHHDREVDGVIFVGSRNRPEEVQVGQVPCVFIGEVPDGFDVWQATVDNEGGGRLVGQHLLSLGHRRVGVLFPDWSLDCARRLRGLRASWEDAGLELPDDWVLWLQSDTREELMEKLPGFLSAARERGEELTSLFCFNDYLAGLTLQVMAHMGLRVPKDISIVGFDNVPYAGLFLPPLTTVTQPFAELGALAHNMLLQQLSSSDPEPKVHRLTGQLWVRASTGRPATG